MLPMTFKHILENNCLPSNVKHCAIKFSPKLKKQNKKNPKNNNQKTTNKIRTTKNPQQTNNSINTTKQEPYPLCQHFTIFSRNAWADDGSN